MNGLRDVAKELAYGVRREARRGLVLFARGRRRLVCSFRTQLPGELRQFQLGDRVLELVELFVPAADLTPIANFECIQLHFDLGEPRETRVEKGSLLAHARAQVTDVTIVWRTRADEAEHSPNITELWGLSSPRRRDE